LNPVGIGGVPAIDGRRAIAQLRRRHQTLGNTPVARKRPPIPAPWLYPPRVSAPDGLGTRRSEDEREPGPTEDVRRLYEDAEKRTRPRWRSW
jgi:hypothetical protein